MRSSRKLLLAAAILAAAFLLVLALRPSAGLVLEMPAWASNTVAGAFHVHTNRSDGSGSVDEVASQAAAAGLQFVIFTDHGDGTRVPEPPRYRSGVLCIDAVEISTDTGHYIAIGLGPAPYPLGGEGRDVVEDVARLGGFGVVAHPDSSKPALKWFDWSARFDAMEWLNADSEWRDEDRSDLVRALLRYPLRPAQTLASFLDRPEQTLQRWDALTQRRRVVAISGADAHARAAWRDEDDANGYAGRWFVRVPSYEASFRAFAMRVSLDRALTRDAATDAAHLIAALRVGKVTSGIDAVASPVATQFTGRRDADVVEEGGTIEAGAPVELFVRTNAAVSTIVLRRNGEVAATGPGPELRFVSPAGPGVYRAEVSLPSSPGQPPVPWALTNPIYVESAGWGAPVAVQHPAASYSFSVQGGPWHVEKDDGSSGSVRLDAPPSGPVSLDYQLAPGARSGQHSALVVAVGRALEARTRLRFRAQASRPMRISVQVRRPSSGERWQRSIYLDQTAREIWIPFKDMRPVAHPAPGFDPKDIDTVLFVVDTTNTAPGTSGSFTLLDVRSETAP